MKHSKNALYFQKYLFMYLFGCSRCYLQHSGFFFFLFFFSFHTWTLKLYELWHVGSSSLNRDQTCVPCIRSVESYPWTTSTWKVKVSQSRPTLCNRMDCIVHGILQARILEWVVFPFSRGSSQPGKSPKWTSKIHPLFFSLMIQVLTNLFCKDPDGKHFRLYCSCILGCLYPPLQPLTSAVSGPLQPLTSAVSRPLQHRQYVNRWAGFQ